MYQDAFCVVVSFSLEKRVAGQGVGVCCLGGSQGDVWLGVFLLRQDGQRRPRLEQGGVGHDRGGSQVVSPQEGEEGLLHPLLALSDGGKLGGAVVI